ncbi:MAG: cysteine hydrolase [Candidatus Thermoplasmatota archaeon]|nr:cysteine hydrolase [Candidatus Thermoplasmatota archaeon]MBU1941137.1 cysteine hydrolase [Candidatus Thermoplasmatota archaeon]
MKLGEITEKDVLKIARDQYTHGNATIPLKKEQTALLVIDMQDEFVKPNWTHFWVPQATKIVPKIQKIIDICRQTDIPIIYTVYSNTHQYLDRPKTLWLMPSRSFTKDIDQTQLFQTASIWQPLKPEQKDIIIHKSSYGAFYDTPLETILKNLGKDTIIITGTLTNYCCGTTARQAYERGFKVIFCGDATATHFQEMHDYELQVLRRGFAKIMSTNEIISTLTQQKFIKKDSNRPKK